MSQSAFWSSWPCGLWPIGFRATNYKLQGTALLARVCPILVRHPLEFSVPANPFSPNAAPFDARGSPFSYTASVSQASGQSELIPCIRPQTREIELTVRDPHRCGCCLLSAFVRHRHHGCHALPANVGLGGESASAPPLELDAHRCEKFSSLIAS